jgi:hypothetical protein
MMSVSVSTLATVLLVLLSALATTVESQTDMYNYCGEKPCIEPLRMSCEEMIDTYRFQGSCCSMETIPQTGGCRITVSFGNCFWYPWCGECDAVDEVNSRCNNIFETDANQRPCPVADFDPVAIQASEFYERPSCSPTMAPIPTAPPEDGSSASRKKDLLAVGMGAVAALATVAAFVAV